MYNEFRVGLLLPVILVVLVNSALSAKDHEHDGLEDADGYSNNWVVHMEGASNDAADLLALKMGYKNLGEVSFWSSSRSLS